MMKWIQQNDVVDKPEPRPNRVSDTKGSCRHMQAYSVGMDIRLRISQAPELAKTAPLGQKRKESNRSWESQIYFGSDFVCFVVQYLFFLGKN